MIELLTSLSWAGNIIWSRGHLTLVLVSINIALQQLINTRALSRGTARLQQPVLLLPCLCVN